MAVDYYKEAAELFALAKFHVTDTQKLKLKVGDILSQQYSRPESLKEALQIYEDIAYEYISNNLMRFQAKKFFFKNVLIFLLLDDDVGAQKKLEKYQDDDPSLNGSYELKFLQGIIGDYKSKNVDEFSNRCF